MMIREPNWGTKRPTSVPMFTTVGHLQQCSRESQLCCTARFPQGIASGNFLSHCVMCLSNMLEKMSRGMIVHVLLLIKAGNKIESLAGLQNLPSLEILDLQVVLNRKQT